MAGFLTYTGKMVYFDKFSQNMVCLEDIAHHLTNICRFGGALPFNKFYSVASHSINLATYLYEKFGDNELACAALLHDASEAYLGDMISSIKPILPDYKGLENKVQRIINSKYNIENSSVIRKLIKYHDSNIILDEVRGLMQHNLHFYKKNAPHLIELGITIEADKNKKQIKTKFLNMCEEFGIWEIKYEI